MHDIPVFADAVNQFKAFLKRNNYPQELRWAFREDFYRQDRDHFYVRVPLPEDRDTLAWRAYECGRVDESVRIQAICMLEETTLATVGFAITDVFIPEIMGGASPQNLGGGLTLEIPEPLHEAIPVSRKFSWNVHKRSHGYRRFQRYGSDILRSNDVLKASRPGLPAVQPRNIESNGLGAVAWVLALFFDMSRLRIRRTSMTRNRFRKIIDRAHRESAQELNLKLEGIDFLPGEIGQLTNLERLSLSDNRLTSLPVEIGQLTALEVLRLSCNQLTSLPPEVGRLCSLKELDLSHNPLTCLPVDIGQLTNLQVLNLFGDSLKSLPGEIGQLTNLRELNLSLNQLSSLPLEIGRLTSLHSLVLCHNQLNALPVEICQLTHLQELNLEGNPLHSPPIQVAEQGLNAIREWFRERGKEPPDGDKV